MLSNLYHKLRYFSESLYQMSRKKTVFYMKWLLLLDKWYVCVKYTGCIITEENRWWQLYKSHLLKARNLLLHKSLLLTCQLVQSVQLWCFRHTIQYCSCCLFRVLFHSFLQSHELCSLSLSRSWETVPCCRGNVQWVILKYESNAQHVWKAWGTINQLK